MTSRRFHTQHRGELELQKKRQTPSELAKQIPQFIDTEMPAQHAEFHTGLSYIPIGTLDKLGRPWASVLVTESATEPSIGINNSAQSELSLTVKLSADDPFYRALVETQIAMPDTQTLFAGVGIDFSNRRRNKLAGVIKHAQRQESDLLDLTLTSDEHLGNCPKYITVRTLVPQSRTPETVFNHFEQLDIELPQFCLDHIDRVSTVFLTTKHSSDGNSGEEDQTDMGLNHRGGAPGFVRHYQESPAVDATPDNKSALNNTVTSYLVLPDFTGNRFYQSLGNIQTDNLVSLVLPDFTTGDVLYVTGEAENLLDEVAQSLMPRVSLLTRIRITGAVFIKHAMDLKLVSDEQFSPYNPPIRYLSHELIKMGHSSELNQQNYQATLSSVKEITPSISTFSFKLSSAMQSPLPGGFGVFDFSDLLDQGYNHMNEANPQLVNEDYVRTWTISSAPNYNPDKALFEPIDSLDITVRLEPDGLISPFLHLQTNRLAQEDSAELNVTFNGVGGEFTCFKKADNGTLTLPPQMLWIAGGVGITPFMSMWEGVLAVSDHADDLATDIVIVFAGREQDVTLIEHFLNKSETPKLVSITVIAFLTAGPNQSNIQSKPQALGKRANQAGISVFQRRPNANDIGKIENLTDREVYLCGPDGLTNTMQEWLQDHGVDPLKVHQESFYF